MRLFNAEPLAVQMKAELTARKVDSESILHVVSSLILTSLRGVDSHGINLFPHYCRAVAAGRVNAKPRIVVTPTGNSTAVVDADHAFGHHAGATAMKEAVALALASGMGAVSVKNSTHFGAAAYFGLMAAKQDCLGFAFTNADPLVKAFGSPDAFFGTNPICFTAPMETEDPFCLDMATSQVSWNKINNYRNEDREIPPGWAFDEAGNNVVNPHLARSLSPIGGYKGFGLGMMVDILCAALSEGPISKDIQAMYAPPLDNSKRSISHFFMALDISRFCKPDLFRHSVQNMADRVRSMLNEPGMEPMVAGDPEKHCYTSRSSNGIPIEETKYAEFIALNRDFEKAVMS